MSFTTNLVPRVLSYPPPWSERERFSLIILSLAPWGRVGESPGNEVGLLLTSIQQRLLRSKQDPYIAAVHCTADCVRQWFIIQVVAV